MDERPSAGGFDLGGAAAKVVAAARCQYHSATFSCQLARDLGPDAATRAGNQRNLARKTQLHLAFLSGRRQSTGSRGAGLPLPSHSRPGTLYCGFPAPQEGIRALRNVSAEYKADVEKNG